MKIKFCTRGLEGNKKIKEKLKRNKDIYIYIR
jgi:hypothetical protein